MVDQLSDRQREILRILVEEYVTSARPIGSETLTRRFPTVLSPATIRHEMAELERQGYLIHQHTSSGRIPSDKGYRYYVEQLMLTRSLSQMEQRTISHQFHQVQLELDEWVRLAASVLAQTSQTAALVTAPKAHTSRLKYFQLIETTDTLALLVLVLQEGIVKQQMINLEDNLGQDKLSMTANRLNALCAGLDREQIIVKREVLVDEFDRRVMDQLAEIMRLQDAYIDTEIYHDGLINILSQPEFSQVSKARQVLEILEKGVPITQIIPQALITNGVQVIIGGENRFDEMRECSVILTRYGVDGKINGVMGVIGPTRMEYGRGISTVRFISGLMSGLLGDLYEGDHRQTRFNDSAKTNQKLPSQTDEGR